MLNLLLCVCAAFLLLPLQLATAQTIPLDFNMASGVPVVPNGSDAETLLTGLCACVTCFGFENCVCGDGWRPPFDQVSLPSPKGSKAALRDSS